MNNQYAYRTSDGWFGIRLELWELEILDDGIMPHPMFEILDEYLIRRKVDVK